MENRLREGDKPRCKGNALDLAEPSGYALLVLKKVYKHGICNVSNFGLGGHHS